MKHRRLLRRHTARVQRLPRIGLDSYFLNYMSLLDVKAGDSVWKPQLARTQLQISAAGVQLSGLDLSAEMLTRCQANLRRWGVEADLYLGNAEHLPFADSTFDVVYTAGPLIFSAIGARLFAR